MPLRRRSPHPGQQAARRLLTELLKGRRYADSVSAERLVDLCCFGVLDDVLSQERTAAGRDRMRARYEAVFSDTVIGLYEDRRDGSRRRFPDGFYDGEQGRANVVILVRNLVDNVLRIPVDEAANRLIREMFYRHGLRTPFNIVFGGSPWAAIEATYPGRFHPWELKQAPWALWQGLAGRQRAIEATRWLFETRLKWPLESLGERTSCEVFERHGLRGMLARVYRGSSFHALDAAYPGRFRPWQLPRTPQGYWIGPQGRSHAIAAMRWLLEDVLGWDEARIKRRLTRETFIQHGLFGMLSRRYRKSLVAAVQEAYPGRYKPWEFQEVPLRLWKGRAGRARAIEATRWLVEDVLGWNDAMVRLCLTRYEFNTHRLGSMLSSRYRGSVWKALQDAYPGRYRKAELFGHRARAGAKDPLMRTFVARLRILVDATHIDAAAVCRRHRISPRQLRSSRERFASHGVAGLLPEPERAVISIDTQRAVLDLTYEQPSLTTAQMSGRLRARGVDVSPAVVLAAWRSHRVLKAKESLRLVERAASYPSVAAAARALGVRKTSICQSHMRLQQGGFAALCYPLGVTRQAEEAILCLVREEPALGRAGILQTLRARGVVVTDQGIRTVLTRYGLQTPAQRLAAGGGLPNVIRDLAAVEPVLRKLLGPQRGRTPASQRKRKPTSQPGRIRKRLT